MSRQVQHDQRAYCIDTGQLSANTSQSWYFPIPKAGWVVRAIGVNKNFTAGESLWDFYLGGTAMLVGGAAAQLSVPASSNEGDIDVIEFDQGERENFAFEAEDGDADTAGVLRITCDGGGAASDFEQFSIVIQP